MQHSNRPSREDDPDHYQATGPDDQRGSGDDARSYRREHYTRQTGRWGADEPSYGRQVGQRPQDPEGRGQPNDRGPQYEQGGQYPGTRETRPGETVRSRSADPGQSSYGGFRGEDPRQQRQQLHYEDRYPNDERQYGWEKSAGQGWHDSNVPRAQRISPKGYVRTDERVREDVCERLSHSGLDVSEVSVQVSEGTVTLEGTVSSRHTKHAIEDCVDDCLGVKDIQNQIRVGGTSHPDRTRMQ